MLACVFAQEAAIVRTIFLEGCVAARSSVEIARCAFALFEGLAVAIVLIEWLTLAVAPAIVVALAIGLSVVIALAVGLAVAVPLLREGLPARATIIASLTVGFAIVRALVVEGFAGAMLAHRERNRRASRACHSRPCRLCRRRASPYRNPCGRHFPLNRRNPSSNGRGDLAIPGASRRRCRDVLRYAGCCHQACCAVHSPSCP